MRTVREWGLRARRGLPQAKGLFPLLYTGFHPLEHMLFPKPVKTRRQERRAEKDHKHKVIWSVRRELIRRDPRCRVCGELLSRDSQMHEIVFRSKLRGKAPEEIFNTKNCLLLCLSCHAGLVRERRR